MKIISVPLTLAAMERLDTNSNLEGDLIDIEISQEDYDSLYDSGMVLAINNKLGINIDDFEDEIIQHNDINKALQIIDEYNCNSNVYKALKKQLINAKEAKTGVFLFF